MFAALARLKLVSLALGGVLLSTACGTEGDPTKMGQGGDPGEERCITDAECNNGAFCDGQEQCEKGACVSGKLPCLESQLCDDRDRACLTDCDTGADADGDGHEATDCGGDDCDDSNSSRYPGNEEVCDSEGVDEDCDMKSLAGPEGDSDEDGVVSSNCCVILEAGLHCGEDCDDKRQGVGPNITEICNGIDDDCNGLLDHPAEDNDGDGHADVLCAGSLGKDCDDTDPRVYFDAPEICDGRDTDCHLSGERSLTSNIESGEDDDGDGHAALRSSCVESELGLSKDDCDDARSATHPDAAELCNGIDDDCDGRIDNLAGNAVAGSACAPTNIAAGAAHSCVIRPDRTVVCWGSNTNGELGDVGAAIDEAVLVPSISDAVQIEAGSGTTCVRQQSGTVSCWGWDGILGARTYPGFVAVPGGFGRVPGLSEVQDLSLGSQHACAVNQAGKVTCWGGNCQGVVAGGATFECATGTALGLTNVPGVSGATQVDVGLVVSCARLKTGEVSCWGPNYEGMLGGGTTDPGVVKVTGISDAVEVAAGADFACALHVDNSVSCWGSSNNGRLGCQGSAGCLIDEMVTSPVKVFGLNDAVHIEAGAGQHACAQRKNGTLVCWGQNDFGQLGDGSWHGPETTGGDHALVPVAVEKVQDVKSFTVGVSHTCATTQSGTYCWGRSDERQLGDGRTVPNYLYADAPTHPTPVSAIISAVQISVGAQDGCFVRHDGGVRCAGHNVWQHIAPAGSGPAASLLQPAYSRADLEAVSVGINFGCRVTRDHELLCTSRYSGDAVSGEGQYDASSVAVSDTAACVIRTDGSVACMGRNNSGQLGSDFTPASSSALYAVPDLEGAEEIAGGQQHFCVRNDEGVLCWGKGDNGQLGSVRVSRSPTPQLVHDLPDRATDIDVYENTSCAVLISGEVYCWGESLGPWTGALNPTPIVGISGKAIQVSVGGDHACARTESGQMYCWGLGTSGQLGDGLASSSATAKPIPSMSKSIFVDCGLDTCCGLRASGQPVCWGKGSRTLANGADVSTTIPHQLTPGMALDLAR